MKLKSLVFSSSALVMSFACMANAALAQNAAAEEETAASEPEAIVVTGSRIQRQDFVAPSPIVTVDADVIANAGNATVDDYLKDLPQFAPGQGDFSNDSNGGTAGRATLNLRALGSQRNLVLLDGQRLVSSGTNGAIDINTIPSLAIGGIEVISGGASATYGSDALSGVVNFKTRRNLNGIEVSGQVASTTEWDSSNKRIGVAYGSDLSGGDGYILLTAEHVERGGVNVRDREFFLNPGISSFIPQGRANFAGEWRSVNDDGTIFVQSNASNPARNGVGYTGSRDLPYLIDPVNGAIGYHGSYDNYLQVPLKRTSFFGKIDHDLGDVTLYAQGIYTTSEARNIGSAPNIAGAPWTVVIPGTNPYLVALRAANPGQFGDAAPSANPRSTYNLTSFQTRITQVGSRVYRTENDTYLAKLGLKGSIGDADINWDVHASYGSATNKDRTISGAASLTAVRQLVNITTVAEGNAICAGGYNPFGGTDPLSPACVDYISRTPLNETKLNQFVAEGVVEGKAFTLPAGDARFALNAQYRSNTYNFNPDEDIETGDLFNLTTSLPTKGTIKAVEVGGELFLPLLRDAPFAKEVNLTVGYRLSDYNLAGTGSTYKAEMDARLTDNIMIRGGYQRALRAPNVGEFFLASETRVVGVGTPPNSGDPCDTRNNPTGDRRALCVADGVPNGALTTNYRAATGSLVAINQGNPDLKPETAQSYTGGVVLDVPLGGAKFQFSADYFLISIDDAIGTVSALDSLQQCYNNASQTTTTGFNAATYRAGNEFCANISRINTGGTLPILQPVRNLGSLETSGVDFAVNLRIPAEFLSWGDEQGSISINSNINYLLSYKERTFATSDEVDFAGTISGGQALPDWRAVTSLRLDAGVLALTGTWRFFDSMKDRSTARNPLSTTPGVDAYSYFDINGVLTVTEDLDLSFGVTNLADKGPPIVGGGTAATNQGTYDAIGRTVFVGFKAKF